MSSPGELGEAFPFVVDEIRRCSSRLPASSMTDLDALLREFVAKRAAAGAGADDDDDPVVVQIELSNHGAYSSDAGQSQVKSLKPRSM